MSANDGLCRRRYIAAEAAGHETHDTCAVAADFIDHLHAHVRFDRVLADLNYVILPR